jgi:hypothetical protein
MWQAQGVAEFVQSNLKQDLPGTSVATSHRRH